MDTQARLGRYLVPILLAYIGTLCLGAFAIHSYQTISPIDELQHLDYVIKAGSGELVLNPGETFGEEAMRIEACRRIEAPFEPPPCDDPDLEPQEFQENGVNTAADGTPSPYHIVTGVLHVPLTWLGFDDLDAARLVSLFFHALGAALIAALIVSVSGSALLGTCLGLLGGVFPHILSQSSTVNPDAWALLAGGCFVALAVFTDRLSTRMFLGLSAVAVLIFSFTKPNWILLIGVPAVVELSNAWEGRDKRRWLRFGGLVAIGVITVVIQFLFGMRSETLALGQPVSAMDTYLRISEGNPFDWAEALSTSVKAVVVFIDIPVVDVLSGRVMLAIAFVWGVFLAGAAMASALSQRFAGICFNLSIAGLLLLVGSPALTYIGQYLGGYYFSYPPRYSFMAIPVVLVALAAWRPLRSRSVSLIAALSTVAIVLLAVVWPTGA